MSEGQAAAAPEPETVEPDGPGGGSRRSAVDAAVLLAVERVGADVASLGRALAAQPEELAARVDVDAASAALGVAVGALGSALDQLRLTLLARLDRTSQRLDDISAAVAAADPGDRLAKVERAVAQLADGVRAGAAVGDALEDLGHRLAAIEDAAGRVAVDAHILVERVAPVPDRLNAIATQVDRITPLARAGDQVGSLVDRLDHVERGLVEVIALLRESGSAMDGGEGPFEGIVDVLAGVTRRQDQVTAAIASVLDQVRGPSGVEAVFDRMEQRERSLAARLDRIDAELRRSADGAGSPAVAQPQPDAETTRALEAMVATVEQHERALARRLDRIESAVRRVSGATGKEAAAARAAAPGDPAIRSLAAAVDSIASITGDLARVTDATAEQLDRRLAAIESRLDEAPPRPQPAAPPASPGASEAAALRLAELRAERALVQARLQEERLLAAKDWDDA